ncbi:hypothetical protein, partial [Microbulbifer hainanensis]|uniref:hypothetical protein n=1 Tax=Microbulbifer hainanensis TaxID=2735675 RepID=UPI001D011EC3
NRRWHCGKKQKRAAIAAQSHGVRAAKQPSQKQFVELPSAKSADHPAPHSSCNRKESTESVASDGRLAAAGAQKAECTISA